MRLATEIVKPLVEVSYSFIEESRNSGRHDGGLASVEWKNSSPLIEEIARNSDEPFLRNPFQQYLCCYGHLWYILVQNWSYLFRCPLGGNKSKPGRHDGGLMPFHKQFNLLLWCKVILNSDEPIMKNATSKHHVIYAACDKNCEVSFEVLYSSIEQARNSGRHDGGLASVEWKNCSPLVEKIVWNSDEPFLINPF